VIQSFHIKNEQQSNIRKLKQLWHHFSQRRRIQFIFLLILMIVASLLEVLSIATILPFLTILMDPDKVFSHHIAQPIVQILNITKPDQLVFLLTVTFGLMAFIAGVIRLLLIWASTYLSSAAGSDISLSMYRSTLYQPYAVHLSRNTSEIINSISNKSGAAINIINMVLNLVSSSLILICILIAMLAVEPAIAIAVFFGFGLIYGLIISVSRNRLSLNSLIIARESTFVIKSLQEGLGGIRDVLIDGSQEAYCQIYRNADLPLRLAQAHNSFISYWPRHGVETLGMIFIATLAYNLAQEPEGIAESIPVLGLLALSAQRVLPLLQQIYGSWSGIQGGRASLQDLLELLEQKTPKYVDQVESNSRPFNYDICLKNVSFRYSPETPWILKNLNLKITKGSRVGIIGSTGCGKSTLLDVIMGLLEPTKGELQIDSHAVSSLNHRAWQLQIAHVPQSIFLADSTIEENIAFGVPKSQINHSLVMQAAKQAQISEIIQSWPLQYRTIVGERGLRLSGGQRQRIGIARALYKDANVIILDEATSALDSKTEEAVMQSIEELNKDITLLIIAHRISTLKNCTKIVELNAGEIKRIGSYQDILSSIK
jgi:ABC-type multidrug transport system fused ATPase/permease subunit